uniref:Uncharacterized protein n=1 Tax=Ananas comosus var. bracteatus TaxID=296719 RepID=A0A6V7NPW4_ANACO|nr:unnamed protein product [Ananas comosus var. bracteatus]
MASSWRAGKRAAAAAEAAVAATAVAAAAAAAATAAAVAAAEAEAEAAAAAAAAAEAEKWVNYELWSQYALGGALAAMAESRKEIAENIRALSAVAAATSTSAVAPVSTTPTVVTSRGSKALIFDTISVRSRRGNAYWDPSVKGNFELNELNALRTFSEVRDTNKIQMRRFSATLWVKKVRSKTKLQLMREVADKVDAHLELALALTCELQMHLHSHGVLSKIQEELKTCRKELHASKETFKKLLMEKSLLEQKVQRLERMTNEEKAELEQKLESTSQALTAAESRLTLRNAELDTLQNSVKELEELREFKADIDRKNEQTATILQKQGAQLAELEALYREEQILRKRYYNTIEGFLSISQCRTTTSQPLHMPSSSPPPPFPSSLIGGKNKNCILYFVLEMIATLIIMVWLLCRKE